MPGQIRRVVTGHNAAGKSIFVSDGPTPHVFSRTKGSAVVHELWETARTPADNRGNADAIARSHRLPPPPNGSVFRVIEYPPDSERLAAIAREHALPDDSGRAEATDRNNPRHPGFHKTATVDYAIVLSGEIYA
ncbi:MAG: cupin domain-containing protein, partial [Xanthobacteraceae bacterium]